TTAGALQLALGTDIVSYTDTSVTRKQVPNPGGPVDLKTDRSTTRWGFSNQSSVAFEGGYGLTDSIVVGGILQLGGASRRDGVNWPRYANINTLTSDTKYSTFNLLIAPKFDYMLLPTSAIRPFFGGAIGILYQSEKVKAIQPSTTQTVWGVSETGLAILLRAGVRCFVTPGFSIDPALMFSWVPTASGSFDNGATSYDASAHGYTIGLGVAASGWVGL
ncbi:MAG TPA: hypothetical protein VIV60_09465, partial [Polyangiaceae bacterium]